MRRRCRTRKFWAAATRSRTHSAIAENLLQQEGLGTFGHIMTPRRRSAERAGSRCCSGCSGMRASFSSTNFRIPTSRRSSWPACWPGDEANVFAVGDPDQAIYQFRGATSGAFDQFLKTFGADSVKRVTMSANRRSTPPILRCAYQAIKCNPAIVSLEAADGGWPRQPLTCARLEREPWPRLAPPGAGGRSQRATSRKPAFIADTIQAMRRERPGLA